MQTLKKSALRLCIGFVMTGTMSVAMAFAGLVGTAYACTPSGGSSCDDSSGVNVTLNGTLTDTVSNASITGGSTVNLTGGSQTISFSFPITLSDSRGGTAQWQLSAKSSGLTVNSGSTTSTKTLTLTSATGSCSTTNSCSSTTVDRTSSALDLTSTSQAFIEAASGGDFGLSALTTNGQFTVDGATIGGTYSATITVTTATAISL